MSNLKRTLIHGLEHGIKYRLSDKGIFNLDSEFGAPSAAYEPMEVVNTCHCGGKIEIELHSCDSNWSVGFIELDEVLPYLRPLSDLTKEIEHKGEMFVPIVRLREEFCELPFLWFNVKLIDFTVLQEVPWKVIFRLHNWHFNVDNLSPYEFVRVDETNNPYK